MYTETDHITVCVPTFVRPLFLDRLLSKLQHQITNDLFSYAVVVVDNDSEESAKAIVEGWQTKSAVPLYYYCEPEQNISLARNKAVENATGNYIAFIDDDEFPVNDWLLNLYRACTNFNADGVLGPVKPHFEGDHPEWLIKGRFCERPSHLTGKALGPGDARTGNVLLKREIFLDPDNWFERQFGRTGGEDIEFFKRITGKGKRIVWCNEAPVYEHVPPERWNQSFYLKKMIRIGGLTGEKVRKNSLVDRNCARVFASFFLYLTALPLAALLGKHIFLNCLIKSAYNFAWLSGFFGHVLIRYRH